MRNEVKKERKEQDVLGLEVGRVHGIGLDVAVALVGGGQRGPVRRGVDKALLVDTVGDDQQVAGAGEVAVDARTLRKVRVRCREEATRPA
jgi:hypothetical protein